MPRPTRWKGCVNGLKGRVRACFICPPIRLTSTPSKWPGPKLSSSCARLKRALWKHSMRRLLRPYKLFLRAMLNASSSMSDSVYDPYGNRYISDQTQVMDDAAAGLGRSQKAFVGYPILVIAQDI